VFNDVHYVTVTTYDLQSVQLVKIVMRRLTTGVRSEKSVIRRFRRRANVMS
jgi:hypothetical protein